MIVSVAIEYALAYLVFGISSTGSYFNVYRYLFISGILSAVLFVVSHIKDGAKNGEKLFAILMFHLGILMILCSPFGHICWDFDSHSKFVLTSSYIGEAYKSEADELIFTNQEFYLAKNSAADNISNIAYINDAATKFAGMHSSITTIAHYPTGIAVAVARFIGLPYVSATVCGRLANLFIYVFVCYFAMKKLKSSKMILATIAFFPTNIFLATNYSYDFWVTAFIMLGMAYFISEIQQPQKEISYVDAVIMCGAFILACLPKQIYMPIMIIPFFMRKNWKNKKEKQKYYAICVIMFLIMFALLAIRAFSSVASGGDTRGGSGVSPVGQIEFIFTEPLHYTKILLNFLKTYLSIGAMSGYINMFAYFGNGAVAIIFVVMIMITTVTDKSIDDRFKGKLMLSVVNALLFFALVCLIATSLYVAFTEVGNETIEGCQSRYVAPLLFPLLVTISNPGIVLKIKKQIYNTCSLIILSAAVFYEIGHIFLQRLI